MGHAEVDVLAELFASARTPRHCWCMSFCTSRVQFAAGWFGGGNQRRFKTMASGGVPMGLLASVDSMPVGWAACGPRSRYLGADPSRHRLLRGRPRTEDNIAWLLPCLFVHPEHRARGVSHALVEGGVVLAREHGAVALEGWPLDSSRASEADAFVGREQLFAALGFRRVERPLSTRVIMRLELVPT